MKVVEALKILQAIPAESSPSNVSLVCGFMPLHLQTLLAAHLQQRLGPSWRIVVQTGLYGDALGNLDRLPAEGAGLAVVVLEWPDLDPRLGLRQLSGWKPADCRDVAANVEGRVARYEDAIGRVAGGVPVVAVMPTLPLPPFSYFPGVLLGPFEAEIRASVAGLAARLTRLPNVKVINPQRLDHLSPPGQRLDVAFELTTGFPYATAHASAVAELVAAAAMPPAPKKGLITDLDDTLWRGILGEVGPTGVSWDLDRRSHSHGLYQQMLHSLAGAGVLIAVASKNDPAIVEEVFRGELAALRGRLFPVEVSWGPKSDAVGRILRSWNVGDDSVVFVDDSPMELAEVQAAHPGVECLLFPRGDDAKVYELLLRLRDLFGKPAVTDDDAIRLESLRRAQEARDDAAAAGAVTSSDDFLARIDAELTLEFPTGTPPGRALELLNKTNQFNLNGRRYTEGDWLAYLRRPGVFLMVVGYGDKYGPLGTVAVLTGRAGPEGLRVDNWVMSCRAFSRRIEHRCLRELFRRYRADEVLLDFAATPRNGPLREFLAGLLGTEPSPEAPCRVSWASFEKRCPPLHQNVVIRE
jgi:FkbH-like protein